jgi:hypothetical protein
MEKPKVVSQSEFVTATSLAEELIVAGVSVYIRDNIVRDLRDKGYTLHRIRVKGRLKYAITRKDAERFLETFKSGVAIDNVVFREKILGQVEESVRQQRESEGWISFRLASAGMPDLINLKRRADGSFEILFEEVKGPGDALRKEQFSVLEGMKEKGIPSKITWL